MMSRAGSVLRRSAIIACLVFLALGAAASLLTLVSLERQRNSELAQSTTEAEGLIWQIYRYREANGCYPLDLTGLRPIAGERPSKNRSEVTDKNRFCARWCWTYLNRGDAAPPIIFRDADYHTRLIYEFAPSSGYYFPPGANEGWIVNQEGSCRYLRSISGSGG
jgi:hypothetical protein